MKRLALGTVQFGMQYGIANEHGQPSRGSVASIVAQARARGMDTLDTAFTYGESERWLGEIGMDGWKVVSKLPAVPNGCADIGRWVDDMVSAALGRLGISRLYGLLLHRPRQLSELNGGALYRALEEIREGGKAEKIGISIYDPAELHELDDLYRFDLVQAPFNLLDHRLIDSGWLQRLVAEGTELHVRSVFLQGLLLMRADSRPRNFDRWKPVWDTYETWLRDAGLTPLEACLRYAYSIPGISKIIVGVDTVAQLEEILTAIDGPTPERPRALNVIDADLLNPGRWKTSNVQT